MHSIKKIFNLALCGILCLGTLNSSFSQNLPDFEIFGGNIVLQNLFPSIEAINDITIKSDRIIIENNVTSLNGEVHIGDNLDKLSDITISLTAKENGEQHIKAGLQNIQLYALKDLLPFLPLSLPSNENYQLTLEFSLNNSVPINLLNFSLHSQNIKMVGFLKLDDNLQLDSMHIDVEFLHASLLNFLPKAFLNGETLELRGSINGTIAWNKNKSKSIDIDLQSDKIEFVEETIFPETQIIKNPQIQASYNYANKILLIDAFDFDFREATLQAKAEIAFISHDNIVFTSNVQMKNGIYQTKNLAKDWPLTVAPKPRAWVTENVLQGYAESLHVTLNGQMKNEKLLIKDFLTKINSINGKFNYWDTMPNVTLPQASVEITKDLITIKSQNAQTADMKNIQASITITLPDEAEADNQAVAEIKILQDYNSVKNLLEIPDLLSAINIPKTATGDKFIGSVQLSFPLLQELEVKDVNFSFDGTVHNFYSPEAPFGANIPIKADVVQVQGQNSHVRIKSNDIDIASIITDLDWFVPLQNNEPSVYTMYFSTHNSFQDSEIFQQIKTRLGDLAHYKYIDGDITAKLSFPKKDMLLLKFDLTEAALDIKALELKKEKGQKSNASLRAILKQNTITRIDDFTYYDDDSFFNMQADIDLNNSYIITNLNSAQWQNSKFYVQGKLIQNQTIDKYGKPKTTFQAEVDVKKLDAASIFKKVSSFLIKKDEVITPDSINDNKNPVDFTIKLTSEQLQNADKTATIENLDFYAEYKDEKLKSIQASMNIEDEEGYIHYENQKHLKVKLANLEKLLLASGISDRIKGGYININIVATDPEPLPQSNFLIKNFQVKEMPFLARLLQLASLSDTISALSGDGLYFNQWESSVTYNDGIFTMSNGRLQGNTISMTMKGTIDLGQQKINLTGILVPFSWLIPKVSNIPILNKFFTDEEGNSLFGFIYNIDSTLTQTDIRVNPLSILTPGIFRNIFQ